MLLNKLQWFRERGWHEISADDYEKTWQAYGGSVITHPTIIKKLSTFVNIPVRYLGWQQAGGLVGAIACWDDALALSRDQLKKRGKRGVFDLGNAEIILPFAETSQIVLRHKARYLSTLNQPQISNWHTQNEQLAIARPYEECSRKTRYNLRRKRRLLEEAGGSVRPIADFSNQELASMYCDLFFKRWGFQVPSAPTQAEVFSLLREFMVGSVVCSETAPIAFQVLFQVESPKWISIEYVNGGVDPQENRFSPGSMLTIINLQDTWDYANQQNKPLRYSFGRADREYKKDWCDNVSVGVTG